MTYVPVQSTLQLNRIIHSEVISTYVLVQSTLQLNRIIQSEVILTYVPVQSTLQLNRIIQMYFTKAVKMHSINAELSRVTRPKCSPAQHRQQSPNMLTN